jgi:hypothetical protein
MAIVNIHPLHSNALHFPNVREVLEEFLKETLLSQIFSQVILVKLLFISILQMIEML